MHRIRCHKIRQGSHLRFHAAIRDAWTESAYRLWSTEDDHPAMIRAADGNGVMIVVEIWSLPTEGLAGILLEEPAGLAIGEVKLEDGSTVLGVIGDPALMHPVVEWIGSGV
jgi:hypothetical protein